MESEESPREGKRHTILVVDDNPAVRGVVVRMLEEAQFMVLSAKDAFTAMNLAAQTTGTIDLLLSDVDMPKFSGPDLGEVLKKSRPDIRVLLMSGGDEGNLLILNHGWAFIQRPFVAGRLIQMIDEVLSGAD